jgi:hypothetical protein
MGGRFPTNNSVVDMKLMGHDRTDGRGRIGSKEWKRTTKAMGGTVREEY